MGSNSRRKWFLNNIWTFTSKVKKKNQEWFNKKQEDLSIKTVFSNYLLILFQFRVRWIETVEDEAAEIDNEAKKYITKFDLKISEQNGEKQEKNLNYCILCFDLLKVSWVESKKDWFFTETIPLSFSSTRFDELLYAHKNCFECAFSATFLNKDLNQKVILSKDELQS